MNQNFQLSDKQFESLKNGNQQIFQLVFNQYFALIHYVVGQCGINAAESNDITQDVFFRLYQNIHKIHHQNSVKSWLVTIARNLAIDSIRKSKKMTDINSIELVDSEDQQISSLTRELEITLIGKLVDQLCDETGDSTLKDFYRTGLSAKQIAEKNNEPISSVTNRLSRLRKKFSQHLQQHIKALRDATPQ